MKKILFSAVAALFATCAMTSCGGGSSNNDEPSQPVSTTVKASFTLTAGTNQTFDDIAVVSVNYTTKDGQNNTSTRTSSISGKLEVSDIECPCTMECTYSYVVMPDKVNDALDYNLTFGPTLTVTTTNGKTATAGKVYSPAKIPGAQVVDAFSKFNKNSNKFTVTVDKDGVISVTATPFEIDTNWDTLVNGGSNSGQTNPAADTKQQKF